MAMIEEHCGPQNDERVLNLGRTAIDVAHDLKNLLFAITAYADMALSQSMYDSRMSRDLNCLLSITERASMTVDQILQYACPKKRPFKMFNIIPVINEIVDMVAMTSAKTVTVKTEYCCKQDVVWGNSTQVYQCVMNLAYNAVYAMQDSGDLIIRVSECLIEAPQKGILGPIALGDYLAVDVIDTGKGIEPELMDKIFQPFFTTKKAARGNGLGLAILRDIMISHLGNILVFSSPEHGTQFRLLFPIVCNTTMITETRHRPQNGPHES